MVTFWARTFLTEKSKEVCIKARSPPASLAFTGQVTKAITVKWPVIEEVEMEI